MQHDYHFKILGDNAVMIYYGDSISLAIHEKIKAVQQLLQYNSFVGFIECVPAYTNICVHYDPYIVFKNAPQKAPIDTVQHYLEDLLLQLELPEEQQGRIVEIPVRYGGEDGPDLQELARYHGLTEEEVIRRHCESEIVVYMLGFAPGFAFMGGMDETLAMPRRDVPRAKIPAGSVGIAGKQTGIYPFETPGGWNIIGRTDVPLFLPEQNPPSLLRAGDRIRFVAVKEDN